MQLGFLSSQLEQIADHLAVKGTGIGTAFDHMLIIDKENTHGGFGLDIIMLGIAGEKKRLAKDTVWRKFIQNVFGAVCIAAVEQGFSFQNQPDFFHGTGILHENFVGGKSKLPCLHTDTHGFLLFRQNVGKKSDFFHL